MVYDMMDNSIWWYMWYNLMSHMFIWRIIRWECRNQAQGKLACFRLCPEWSPLIREKKSCDDIRWLLDVTASHYEAHVFNCSLFSTCSIYLSTGPTDPGFIIPAPAVAISMRRNGLTGHSPQPWRFQWTLVGGLEICVIFHNIWDNPSH